MPLARLLTGHGAPVTEHARLVRGAPARPSPPLRAHPSRSSTTARARRSRSPAGCGRSGRCCSSRCSSSGRWSATSSCCWPPAPWPSAVGDGGSVFELTAAGPRGAATDRAQAAAPTRRPRLRGSPVSRTDPSIATRAGRSISPAAWRSSPAARAGSASRSRGRSRRPARTSIVASRKEDACQRGRGRAALGRWAGGRPRVPRRPLGRPRAARGGGVRRVRPRRRPRQQRRGVARCTRRSPR